MQCAGSGRKCYSLAGGMGGGGFTVSDVQILVSIGTQVRGRGDMCSVGWSEFLCDYVGLDNEGVQARCRECISGRAWVQSRGCIAGSGIGWGCSLIVQQVCTGSERRREGECVCRYNFLVC